MELLSLTVKHAREFLVAQWKWIVISIILLLILYFSFKVYSVFEERNDLLTEREGKITQLVKENTEAEIEKQSLQQTLDRKKAEDKRIDALYQITLKRFDKIDAEIATQKQIFLNHDFTRLSNAKPGLIIPKMNNATKERFDEIANTFNN